MARPLEGVAKVPTCFIAMPISASASHVDTYGDEDHWRHVIESLFVPAVEAAGFVAIRPAAQGAHLIHANIIAQLSEADLVLCDLSSHNPNVFFELGVRTSLNLPIALVRDEHTSIPFDTSGINTHQYRSSLRGWEIEGEKKALTQHISECQESCAGSNPLWRQFGLSLRAQEPDSESSPLEAKLDIMADRLIQMQYRLERSAVDAFMDDSRSGSALRGGLEHYPLDRLPAPIGSFDLFRDAVERNRARLHSVISLMSLGPSNAQAIVDSEMSVENRAFLSSLAERHFISLEVQTSHT